MALPSQLTQQSLEFIVNGMPYLNVTGKSSIVADGIHFNVNGMPYRSTSPDGGGGVVTYNTTQFFLLF